MREEQSSILLESGTNEFTIMEFTIAGEVFGINVEKVREIMKLRSIKPMQKAQECIEGIFKSRDRIVTVIDLAGYLGLPKSENSERDIYIITNFNNSDFAFHVHAVVGIDRIFWSQIQKPDKVIYGNGEGVATAIADYDGRLITILDFEKIVAEINPELTINPSDIQKLGKRNRSERPILIAEDSMLLSRLIVESLHRAGYVNTVKVDNGEEAWAFLTEAKESGESIDKHVAGAVLDIEMPKMDGHYLTKLIKGDPALKKIPVILFSSLINDETRLKGEQVGADAQVSKPEIAKLVTLLDQYIGK